MRGSGTLTLLAGAVSLVLAGGCSKGSPTSQLAALPTVTVTVTATVTAAPEPASPGVPVPAASAVQSPTPSGTPWSEVVAEFTAGDGTKTRMPADTVRYCINEGAGINLNESQDIPFEKMRSLEVLRSDKLFTPEGKATVRVTLVSGETLTGTVGGNCDFFGTNDLGRYSLYPQRLKRIDFGSHGGT